MTGTVAYNPSDPNQKAFLASLAQGETGGQKSPSTTGVGGVDLSGAPTDAFGFPIWSGNGTSHAAGTYQFQPGTWDPLAAQYGLSFQKASDQDAGAWYLAQATYAQKSGGGSLEDALAAGHYQDVQSALAGVWPSVGGNAAAPQGLAGDIAAALSDTANANTGTTTSSSSGGVVGTIESFFVRFGLIILGGIVILVALWMILSDNGVIPSPAKVVKALPALAA